jgi:hypothetical protein
VLIAVWPEPATGAGALVARGLRAGFGMVGAAVAMSFFLALL